MTAISKDSSVSRLPDWVGVDVHGVTGFLIPKRNVRLEMGLVFLAPIVTPAAMALTYFVVGGNVWSIWPLLLGTLFGHALVNTIGIGVVRTLYRIRVSAGPAKIEVADMFASFERARIVVEGGMLQGAEATGSVIQLFGHDKTSVARVETGNHHDEVAAFADAVNNFVERSAPASAEPTTTR